MTNILDSIRLRPDRQTVGLLEEGSGLSWQASDIMRIAGALANSLAAQRIGRNDRVAILVPDGPELCLAFLGVSCHAIAAPLNPKAAPEDLRSWLQDLAPAAMLLSAASPRAASEVADELGIPVVRFDIGDMQENQERPSLPDAPNPDDIALILHTSGTTAKAKMVPLTHRNLLRSAHAIAETLRLGPDDVCLNLMPMFHIHGIVACLLAPLVSGGQVIVAEGMDATRFYRLLVERRPTWYSAVPTRHRDLLDHLKRHPEALVGHALRFIRSSSAALPVAVLDELETRFGVPVVEAYGMTEAAHQMCSNPLPPDVRKPGSVGRAAGPEVALADEQGRLLPTGATGEVVIRGEQVTPGYLDLPMDRQGRLEGGWFRTGDLGRFDDEGYLFLTGRVKEIVNRGGEKVSPAEVDAVLLAHPSVAEAACFGVPHPTLGEDLAAAVRLHPGQPADEALLRGFLFERLSHFKIPSRILVVDSIPKSSIGKVQRSRLAQTLQGSLSPSSGMPANPDEAYVANVFRQVIPGCGPVGRHDNFFSLGGDSLHGIRAAHTIGAHYRIEVPAHEIFRHPTPGALSRRVEELRSAQLLDALESRLSTLSEEQLIAFLNNGMTDN